MADYILTHRTGIQLRHLAKQNGWVLGWALGNWNASSSGGHGGHHHYGPPPPATEYQLAGRVLDPLSLLGGTGAACTAGHNLSLPATTASMWSL